MIERSIEVYYDIEAIPGLKDRSNFSSEALKFRNKAMHHIEAAIIQAELGEWSGAEIGLGEVNFGFVVNDFDAAEQVVRDAVRGTEFEGLREIERREIDTSEFESEDFARPPLKFRLLSIFLTVVVVPMMLVGLMISGLRGAIRR